MGGGGLQMWDVVRESEKDIRTCISILLSLAVHPPHSFLWRR